MQTDHAHELDDIGDPGVHWARAASLLSVGTPGRPPVEARSTSSTPRDAPRRHPAAVGWDSRRVRDAVTDRGGRTAEPLGYAVYLAETEADDDAEVPRPAHNELMTAAGPVSGSERPWR